MFLPLRIAESECFQYSDIGFVSAGPGADLSIALLLFLQTKTQYTALTLWTVWARDFVLRAWNLYLMIPYG
jgi:hypothetical protein